MNDWKISDASRSTGLPGSILSCSFVLVILTLLFATGSASGDETPKQNLEFRWKFIKVGSMDFEIGPIFFSDAAVNAGEFGQPLFVNAGETLSASESGGAPVHLAVTGITSGPLKWFKNYQARAELLINAQSRTFVLAGEDNGIYEKRALVFAQDLPPTVESFIDSTAARPLEIQNAWKHDTVDPLTVFEWMIFAAVKGQSCVKNFWIYDGKRRYAARTLDLDGRVAVTEEQRITHCRLTLIGTNSNKKDVKGATKNRSSARQAGDVIALSSYDNSDQGEFIPAESNAGRDKVGWGSFWPFGKGDRHIDFGFRVCDNQRVFVERVEMAAPIGKVVGTTKGQC